MTSDGSSTGGHLVARSRKPCLIKDTAIVGPLEAKPYLFHNFCSIIDDDQDDDGIYMHADQDDDNGEEGREAVFNRRYGYRGPISDQGPTFAASPARF